MDQKSFDLPGTVRRVRRLLDLSQRDLATRLGVDASTVGRWESGDRDIRSRELVRLLELAALRMVIVAADGSAVAPMGDDTTVRDAAGRFFPAHLDVWARTTPDPYREGRRQPDAGAPRRGWRDWLRERGELDNGDQHPTDAAIAAAHRARAEAFAERSAAIAEQVRRRRAAEPRLVPCFCPLECEEVRGCLPECPCRCEPEAQRPPAMRMIVPVV